ncbi:MAG: ParA family protein [Clostridia bacterium]|nr:ParA family protein [Clostridia bacterium]
MKADQERRRVTVICGHYGAGKTNIAVNLAIGEKTRSGRPVYLADLDVVNPYFRAADAADLLREAGVVPLIPEFANSNVDIPSLPPMLPSVLEDGEDAVFLDVGGDDGAVVLGGFADRISAAGYSMICIMNMYRPLTATPDDAAKTVPAIERLSRLSVTGIINNSSLGAETTADDILASVGYAERTAEIVGVPLIGHSYIPGIAGDLSSDPRFSGLTLIPLRQATRALF